MYYANDRERQFKELIDSNIKVYGIVTVEYYVDNGNRCDIYNTNGQVLVKGLTLENAYWTVLGIEQFWSKFPFGKEA